MSRSSSSLANRPLSTTEELEKLEQSITLTLQEIDHNFSKAHRIVTTNILPVVEQYGEHCKSVWDASKFWKQFFEAAANVSLSGYEDLANNDEDDTTGAEETTATSHDETSTDYTPRPQGREHDDGDQTATYNDSTRDESLLTDGGDDLSGSTPRPPATKSLSQRPQFADMDSPYETLRRELNQPGETTTTNARSRSGSRPRHGAGGRRKDEDEDDAAQEASTAWMDVDDRGHGHGHRHGHRHGHGRDGHDDNDSDDDNSSAADSELLAQRTARLPNMSMTPRPSPSERTQRALEDEQATALRQRDPLLHRVLDKTYRIQATPHKNTARGISPMRLRVTDHQRSTTTTTTATTTAKAAEASEQKTRAAWQESSPMSSPEMAVPKLRSAAFLSPVRAAYRNKLTAAVGGPRTPGVSVQTPVRKRTQDVTFADIDPTGTTQPKAGETAAAAAAAAATAAAGGRAKRDPDEITWESSDEDGDDLYGGISPPKTISFALPPSKLLQTPAREASKRIVDEILLTAGEDLDRSSEYSPTIVKMSTDILDDTF
ncbi:dash complex subunit [Niveomyces insectorum RCEF 264]|uniref:DASH complex subunit ASK1 n=1 Tax=Niveomyces insectorum RCEF 264 TaxID=1081102 RepID=A0A167MVU8_9HYPO|nr:dash complex subunit [Niveomyces insectorum RCEF 264]